MNETYSVVDDKLSITKTITEEIGSLKELQMSRDDYASKLETLTKEYTDIIADLDVKISAYKVEEPNWDKPVEDIIIK